MRPPSLRSVRDRAQLWSASGHVASRAIIVETPPGCLSGAQASRTPRIRVDSSGPRTPSHLPFRAFRWTPECGQVTMARKGSGARPPRRLRYDRLSGCLAHPHQSVPPIRSMCRATSSSRPRRRCGTFWNPLSPKAVPSPRIRSPEWHGPDRDRARKVHTMQVRASRRSL